MTTPSTTARAIGIAALLAVSLGAGFAAPADAREVVLRAPYAETSGGGCARVSADRMTGRFTYRALWPLNCYGAAILASKNPLRGKAHRQIATLHVRYARVVPDPLMAGAWLVIPHYPSYPTSMDCEATSLLSPEEQASLTPVTVVDRTITLTCGPTEGYDLAGAELRVYHQPGASVEVDATLTSIVLRTV